MYPNLQYPPKDYHICVCCGTEFGNDDAFQTHEELRRAWLRHGAPWFFGDPPQNWNADQQLLKAGINYSMSPSSEVTFVGVLRLGDWQVSFADAADKEETAVFA